VPGLALHAAAAHLCEKSEDAATRAATRAGGACRARYAENDAVREARSFALQKREVEVQDVTLQGHGRTTVDQSDGRHFKGRGARCNGACYTFTLTYRFLAVANKVLLCTLRFVPALTAPPPGADLAMQFATDRNRILRMQATAALTKGPRRPQSTKHCKAAVMTAGQLKNVKKRSYLQGGFRRRRCTRQTNVAVTEVDAAGRRDVRAFR
jgi:hypothetical protein